MIYYLHGFNSAISDTNPKIQALSLIDKVQGINYNSFSKFEDIVTQIESQIIEDDFTIIGTSLGGFFSSVIAKRHSCPAVLINPAYYPYDNLKPVVGLELTNYVTEEKNILTEEARNSYSNKHFEIGEFKPLTIIARDDELIDYKISSKIFSESILEIVESGGHIMNNLEEHIHLIEKYINNCSISSILND